MHSFFITSVSVPNRVKVLNAARTAALDAYMVVNIGYARPIDPVGETPVELLL